MAKNPKDLRKAAKTGKITAKTINRTIDRPTAKQPSASRMARIGKATNVRIKSAVNRAEAIESGTATKKQVRAEQKNNAQANAAWKEYGRAIDKSKKGGTVPSLRKKTPKK